MPVAGVSLPNAVKMVFEKDHQGLAQAISHLFIAES